MRKALECRPPAPTSRIGTVKFAGVKSRVNGIGAHAFDTKAGRKVKSIVSTIDIDKIGAYAFKNTKSLTRLKLLMQTDVTRAGNKLEVGWVGYLAKSIKVHKKAFSGCGKRGGAGLKVRIGAPVTPERQNAYRTFFAKYGLSKKATWF